MPTTNGSEVRGPEKWARAVESCGIWLPIAIILPFIPYSTFPMVFWSAFGSGSLLAAAALICLSFLAIESLSAPRLTWILLLVVVAVSGHTVMLNESLRVAGAPPPPMFDYPSIKIWLTIIFFLVIAAVRTKFLLWSRSGFSEQD